MIRSRLFAAALVTALAGGIATLPVGSANAAGPSGAQAGQHGIGIRLLDASVTRKNDPRAHIYIDDFVHPGSSMTRHVEVSDFTSKPVTLQMYAVASTIDQSGWQVADGRTANELTSWMKVTPSSVNLAPGQSQVVTVQIDVPANAAKGERYATVVAELPPPPSNAPGTTVRVASRVGVRVYLGVGNGGEPASNFTVSTLTATRAPDGTPTVDATVTNTGGRALDLDGQLVLADGPGGLRAGPFTVQIPRTLGIGETGDVLVTLDKQTPAGPWLAKMTLRSGYVSHTVTGHITFPAPGAPAKIVAAQPVKSTSNVLVLAGIGLGALVVIGVLLLLWRRRRRDDDGDSKRRGGPAPTVPSQRMPERVREPALVNERLGVRSEGLLDEGLSSRDANPRKKVVSRDAAPRRALRAKREPAAAEDSISKLRQGRGVR